MQGSILSLLSFLLGFTFSIAIHHFDERSLAMKDEANAISGAFQAAKLLPEAVRFETLTTIKRYIDVRVHESEQKLNDIEIRKTDLNKASILRTRLQDLLRDAVKLDDRMVTTGVFSQALAQINNTWGTRNEVITRHIPFLVIMILILFVLFAGSLIGYTSAINRHNPSKIGILYLSAIVILIYVLIDLDQPRRGFIKVHQQNLIDLQKDCDLSKL